MTQVIKKIHLFEGEFQNYSLIMSKQVFKKAASHATLSFLLGIDRCEMTAPPTFLH